MRAQNQYGSQCNFGYFAIVLRNRQGVACRAAEAPDWRERMGEAGAATTGRQNDKNYKARL
jgi:hypothetical protein